MHNPSLAGHLKHFPFGLTPVPVLSAPSNRRRRAKTRNKKRPAPAPKYTCQIVVSWPSRPGFFGRAEPLEFPSTNGERVELLRDFAQTWAEPFRGLVLGLSGGTEVKALDLYDCVPPQGLKGNGRVVLMGDALHQMTMCKSAHSFAVGEEPVVEIINSRMGTHISTRPRRGREPRHC